MATPCDEFSRPAPSKGNNDEQGGSDVQVESLAGRPRLCHRLRPDRAIDFYVNKLGFEKTVDVRWATPAGGSRWRSGAPTTIALAPPPQGTAAGGSETGICLDTSDVDTDHATEGGRGRRRRREVARWGGPIPPMFWLRDPDKKLADHRPARGLVGPIGKNARPADGQTGRAPGARASVLAVPVVEGRPGAERIRSPATLRAPILPLSRYSTMSGAIRVESIRTRIGASVRLLTWCAPSFRVEADDIAFLQSCSPSGERSVGAPRGR